MSSTVFRPRHSNFYPSMLISCLLVLLLLVLTPRVSHAQMAAEESPQAWTVGLSVGHGRRTNPFVASDDVDIHAVVDLAWYGKRFFFDNGDVGFTLHETARFSVNAVLGFNNERNYFSYLGNGSSGIDIFSLRQLAEDNGFAASGISPEAEAGLDTLTVEELEDLVFKDIDSDLPERDFAVNGGFELLYLGPWGDLHAQVLTDVSSTHNGHSALVAYSYPWFTPSTEYSLMLGLEWKSHDLVDYYYGVTPGEQLPGRPVYEGSGGTNSIIRLSATHELSSRWYLVGVLERESLSNAIRRSPIIKDHKVDTAYVGLYYQF